MKYTRTAFKMSPSVQYPLTAKIRQSKRDFGEHKKPRPNLMAPVHFAGSGTLVTPSLSGMHGAPRWPLELDRRLDRLLLPEREVPTLHHAAPPCTTLRCPTRSYPATPHPTLPYPVIRGQTPLVPHPCPTRTPPVPYPTPPCPALPHPAPPYRTLRRPTAPPTATSSRFVCGCLPATTSLRRRATRRSSCTTART